MTTDKKASDTGLKVNLDQGPQVRFAVVNTVHILGREVTNIVCLRKLG